MALLTGLVTGFLGAIPPGPLNVTVINESCHARTRIAYRVALGGALVDFVICALLGFGAGWILEKVVSQPVVKGGLGLFVTAYGVTILVHHIRSRRAEKAVLPDESLVTAIPEAAVKGSRAPFLMGILQGAANPVLVMNWTFVLGFLFAHRLVLPERNSLLAFALGVGLGVFAWFAVIIETLRRLHDHPIGGFLRRSTIFAGILLIAFGCYFTWKTVNELVGA